MGLHFELNPDLMQWLRQQSLMIEMPMHDLRLHGHSHFSIMKLQRLLNEWGISHRFSSKMGDSLVTRARNVKAAEFEDSKHTHLLLIDSDIQFDPHDVIYLLALSRTYRGILGAPYAKKHINWQRVAQGIGLKKEFPLDWMPAMGGDAVANFLKGEHQVWQPDKLLREIGTGFSLYPRYVFSELKDSGLIDSYKVTDQAEIEATGRDRIWAYFEAKVLDDEYVSEDWYICRRWKQLGNDVWLCPWMITTHWGTYGYPMNFNVLVEMEEDASQEA